MEPRLPVLMVVLLAFMTSVTAGQLKKCMEEDICSTIIFNQLALGQALEGIRTLQAAFNESRIEKDVIETTVLSECKKEKLQQMTIIENLKNQSVTLETECTTLQKENADLRYQNLNLEGQTIALLAKTEELQEQIESLELKNSKCMQNDQRRDEEDMTELREHVQKLLGEKQDLQEEKHQLQQTIQRQEEQITILTLATYQPVDCADIQTLGQTESGIYTIYPFQNDSIEVLCDLESAEGAWTVFLSRMPQETPLDFNENWDTFKEGFGDINTEFWLGNDLLHLLTAFGPTTLRVDAENFLGDKRWAEWKLFAVADEHDNYRVTIEEYDPSSTLGDSLSGNSNSSFTTYDVDNDYLEDVNCAVGSSYSGWGKGGFWYHSCGSSRPTAPLKNTNRWDSACWSHWGRENANLSSIRVLSMKIRRHSYRQLQVPAM